MKEKKHVIIENSEMINIINKTLSLKKKYFIMGMTWSIFLLFNITSLKSQDTPADKKPSLYLIARPLQDSILLRWAPSDYKSWDLGNKYGYTVIRYTIMQDTLLIDKPVMKVLTDSPLRPLALNQWESLAKKNKYGAIAAQALYGETFSVDAGEGLEPQKVYYKSLEQEQRFSFAMYSADMSPEVAQACGLWLTDETAAKNEKYLYRVMVSLPDTVKTGLDTAYIFTGISEYMELPKPVEFSADFSDRMVFLGWNTFVHNQIFVAWIIERSSNGGRTFEAVTLDPLVPVATKDNANPEYSFKMDSLPENDKEYQYRVRGITSFGEFGPWSDVIKGKGIQSIQATPNITKYDMVKSRVLIRWEFPSEFENSINGFRILRANNDKYGFEVLSDKIKPAERQYIDKTPLSTGYYKVVAYRDSTTEKQSFPFLVQLTDSIPPKNPEGLFAIADTSGIIRIRWNPNTDEDLYGYRVFRSASGKDEYSQRTHAPVADTFYVDTLSKKDLNKNVFYKIMAVDQRQNESEFSKIFKVEKPDLIPPSMPVFSNMKATENGIELLWVNSTSDDVEKHEIYRNTQGSNEWLKLEEIAWRKNTLSGIYLDSDCPTGIIVRYKINAVDKSGNASDPAVSIDLKGLKATLSTGVGKIEKQVDYEKGRIKLQWKAPEKEVTYFKVYRETSEKTWSLYETLPGNTLIFEDDNLKAGNFYAYRVKVIYGDGSVSGFSDEIKIGF